MFKSLGSLISVEPPVSDDEAPVQGAVVSDIVARPDGGFTIAYAVGIDDLDNPSRNLYLRSYDAAGHAEGDSVAIDMSSNYGSYMGARFGAYNNLGVAVFGQRNDSFTLSLRDYSPTGTLQHGPDPVIPAASPSVFITDAVGLANGKSFLLYQDDFSGDTLLRARVFNADHSPAGNVITLSSLAGVDQTSSTADQLDDGGIVVAYAQANASDAGDIYAMIRKPTGGADVSPFRVNAATAGRQYDSDVAALTSGGFAVAWTSAGDGYENVFMRVYDDDGKAETKALQVSKGTDTFQSGADVVAVSGGRFAVVWEDSLAGGQIKAQLYDRLGDRIGGETVLTKSAPPNYFDQSPHTVEIGNGILAVGWTRDIEQEGILARRYDVGQAGTNNADKLDAADLGRVLEGLGGNDVLTGSSFADLLIGGGGRDKMTGNGGADAFIFEKPGDMGRTKSSRDIVTDFGEGKDHLDLKDIDAVAGGKDNAFRFIKAQDFSGADGQLHYLYSGKATIVEGDINGDRKADFQIELSGHIKLDAGDFIL
jgi:Ca2+-binding RTX toxin-like protein